MLWDNKLRCLASLRVLIFFLFSKSCECYASSSGSVCQSHMLELPRISLMHSCCNVECFAWGPRSWSTLLRMLKLRLKCFIAFCEMSALSNIVFIRLGSQRSILSSEILPSLDLYNAAALSLVWNECIDGYFRWWLPEIVLCFIPFFSYYSRSEFIMG